MSKYTINTSTNITEEKDTLGGGSYLMESDAYDFIIKHAFIKQAKSGALALSILVRNTNKQEHKEDLWFVSGDAKGNKTFFTKDGVDRPLPSYTVANNICIASVGKTIDELLATTEPKIIKQYDYASSSEQPTEVDMIMALKDQPISLGILKETVDKTAKNEATNKYEPTGETKDINRIDKVFRASDGKTVSEIKSDAEASFKVLWVEKNQNETRNLAKGASNNNNKNASTESSTFSF